MFHLAYRRGMAANYNRPKPIDPIWFRADCYLQIRCACGRALSEPLGEFARDRGISDQRPIYELVARLKCSVCGENPRVEVTRYRAGR